MDNEAATTIATSEAFSKKLRHVNCAVQWVREQVRDEVVSLNFMRSEFQAADFLTKALGRIQHNHSCELNVINIKYEFEPYMVQDRVRKGKGRMYEEKDRHETSASGESRENAHRARAAREKAQLNHLGCVENEKMDKRGSVEL